MQKADASYINVKAAWLPPQLFHMKYLHMESKKKDHKIYKPELWVDSNIYHHQQYVDPLLYQFYALWQK